MANILNLIKRNRENVIIFILLFVIASLFMLQSPMHPLINGEPHTDASVFKLIALMMKKGYMPYRDTFDHKGPLLYVINYIGVIISEDYGIWIIEKISLVTTLLSMYKIARLFCNKLMSFVITFVSLCPLFVFFATGNFSEEYALPFISVSLLIFIDYFVNNRITNLRLFICGLCLGSVLMLRPNMIGVWAVMAIGVLIKLLKEKSFQSILKFLIWFLLGVIAIVLPLMIWIVLNHSFSAFFFDYIVFNIKYVGNNSLTILEKIKDVWFFIKHPTVLISLIVMIIMCIRDKKFFNIIYLICFLINIYLICIAGRTNTHYGMILIPLTIYPLSIFLKDIKQTYMMKYFGLLIMAYLIIVTSISFINVTKDFINKTKNGYSNTIAETIKTIVDKYTTVNEPITCYGNWDYIYIYCNRLPAGKYSYQWPIGQMDSTIMNEYIDDLYRIKPKIIIIPPIEDNNKLYEYIENNHYFQVETNSNVKVYVKEY